MDPLNGLGDDEKFDVLPAEGIFADYRRELAIATRRMEFITHSTLDAVSVKNHDWVLFHSLIDSVVYPTVRFYRSVNKANPSSEDMFRWNLLLHLNAMMLRDSFPTNPYIYFLRGNDGEEFSEQIEEGIEILLNDWGFNYVSTDSATNLIQIVNSTLKHESIVAGKEIGN